MQTELHSFHIPVMGIGHSVDTPIRVAPFGISSVISLVDDLLLEKLRRYYSQQNNLQYLEIPKGAIDGRALRIAAYLDMMGTLVNKKIESMRHEPFFEANDKRRYFELLPDESPLKIDYRRLQKMEPGAERDVLAKTLSAQMQPGSIDVNIMVKLDRIPFDQSGQSLNEQNSDAKTALRGFATSAVKSSVIFSAGMNPKLFTYVSQFKDFYRDVFGSIKKKIILKVSDFRSAMIQSRFLAKRGLEVWEYRIESGLNCGGHAFSSRGQILPYILKEFREKWQELLKTVRPLVREYYQKMGWTYDEAHTPEPLLTVQGGIGTSGEAQRFKEEFGVDRTGWASPFLLVPEVTNVDDVTRELLASAKGPDLYLSQSSPLGIPFNSLRGSKSNLKTQERIQKNRPGSGCPKGFATINTEFTEKPICVASRQYQKKKLEQIESSAIPEPEKAQLRSEVMEKACICDQLSHGVLVKLGLMPEGQAAQAICPGPNIAWFDRTYSLKEMVDHIYGRGSSLVPESRPHVFANEIIINIDYLNSLLKNPCDNGTLEDHEEYKKNLEKGIDLCLSISQKTPFPNENLGSIQAVLEEQTARLNSIWDEYVSKKSRQNNNAPAAAHY